MSISTPAPKPMPQAYEVTSTTTTSHAQATTPSQAPPVIIMMAPVLTQPSSGNSSMQSYPLSPGVEIGNDSSDSSSDLPHSTPELNLRRHNSDSSSSLAAMTQQLVEQIRCGDLQQLHTLLLSSSIDLYGVTEPLVYRVVLQLGKTGTSEADKALIIHIVKRLIALGASVTRSDEYSRDALHIALDANHEALFSTLMEAGIRQGLMNDAYKATLLQLACERNFSMAAKCLLQHGANPNAHHKFGVSPLQAACTQGNLELVSALVRAGAILDTANNITGDHPLIIACRRGHDAVIQWLAKNCPLDVIQRTNHQRQSALLFAARHASLDSFQALLEAQAGLHQDDADRDLFEELVSHKHLIVQWTQRMALFLLHLPDINVDDAKGRTLLFYAAKSGDLALVKMLLDFGANPLHVDHDGRTAGDYGVMFTESDDIHLYLKAVVNSIKDARLPGRDSNSSAI